jgi:hypothetical protein
LRGGWEIRGFWDPSYPKTSVMRCYHFHVFDGQVYDWDNPGVMLPDLATVVQQAEAKAVAVMRSRPDIHDWTKWKIDVRGHDDITIFHYPFDEVRKAA